MDRKEFLSQMGMTSAAVFMGACMAGCSKDDNNTPGPNPTPPPSNVDFTVNLSDPTNAALNTAGGFLYKNNIIVAKTVAGSFIAVSQVCTHQGTTIVFQGNNNRFYCPNHGATFSTTGAVTNGPANTALASYNTQLTGTTLRVFS
jgi:cytochrome b6-f complex iron-sulfur subunit